jgi:hypothetical protein
MCHLIFNYRRERDTFEARWRFLIVTRHTRPRLRRARGGECGPIVIVDLSQVLRDLIIIEDQAGVAIRL